MTRGWAVAAAVASALVLAGCSSTGPAMTDKQRCEAQGGTWEWDSDLSNALATSKPRPRTVTKPRVTQPRRTTARRTVTVARSTSTTSTTTKRHVRSGWECDLDGDDD